MYKIIGGDQKEYGPVTEDELRRWIVEGRLNGQSRVRLEGQTDWQPLSLSPEFADALASQIAPTSASVAAGVTFASVRTDEILAREPVVGVGDCLARSWKLLTANFGLVFCASFLAWLILLVQFIPLVGGFLSFLAYGILFGGLYSVFLNRIRGRPAAITDVFAGFSVSPAQLMLVGFLTALLTKIGTICCFIIPGVYLQVAWAFAIALVADKRLEFWGAMELSRKVVTRVWFKIFGLLLVSFLPYLLCYLAVEIILVGRIFPTIQGMLSSGQPDYQRMTETIREIIKNTFSLVVMLKFVLLLNLPFAVGALMYAYEDLFGPRPASTT